MGLARARAKLLLPTFCETQELSQRINRLSKYRGIGSALFESLYGRLPSVNSPRRAPPGIQTALPRKMTQFEISLRGRTQRSFPRTGTGDFDLRAGGAGHGDADMLADSAGNAHAHGVRIIAGLLPKHWATEWPQE